MSNIYEKLKHFNEVILKDAASERDRILNKIKTNSEEHIALEKRKFQEQADQLLKKESALAESEKNNIISRANMDGRQLLVKTREEIVEAVYNDAKSKLYEFVQKEDYLPYLSRQIKHSCKQAGEGKLIVYLSSSDMERFSTLLEAVKKDLSLDIDFEQTADDIIGGCKVLNKTRGIVVDNTLLGKLESNRNNILTICDLKI